MKITLRLFASLREALGTSNETLETQAATLGELRRELAGRGDAWAQALGPARNVRMALDQVLAGEGDRLRDGAEVAFFPPVTGG